MFLKKELLKIPLFGQYLKKIKSIEVLVKLDTDNQ